MMQITLATITFLYVVSLVGYFVHMIFQKNYPYYFAKILMGIGFLIHTILLLHYGFEYGTFPVSNLHAVLLVIVWSIVIVFFVVQYKYHLKMLGVYVALISSVLTISAVHLPKTSLNDPNLFKSAWLGMHVCVVFLGDAALALAFCSGILYLIQENAIKKKKRGFFFNRLPSLELLDTTAHACVLMGFVFLTIGLIAGAVYAEVIWGRFWSWDPKEVWSLITWLFYAMLFYQRLLLGWRGRKFAIMAVIGFGMLLFTFLGVNLFLKGHHGPFTKI